MSSLNSAPKQTVIDIWKTGTYGQTVWHHRLDCGHVAQRSRRSPAQAIGCLACTGVTKNYTAYDPDATRLSLEQHTVAGLALKFGITPEFIDVHVEMAGDRPYPSLAIITLTHEDLKRLL